MKVFYISPTGSGSRSGSSAANAGTIYDLPRLITTSSGAPTSLGGSEQQTVETVIAANWKSA